SYALAVAADRVFASPSTMIGSIGIIEPLLDLTAANERAGIKAEMIVSGARKADGNSAVAISDEARAAKQHNVDALAGVFFAHVAARRGVDMSKIQALEAGIMIAGEALTAGLIDEIATWEQVLAFAANPKVSASADEDMPMKLSEARKALQALAEGDDKEEAAKAKKALAAMDEGEADEDKEAKAKAEEEEAAKAKAEEDEAAKAKAEEEDEKEAAKAMASGGLTVAQINKILDDREATKAKAEAAKATDNEARTKILAARPDLTPDHLKSLVEVPTGALAGVVNLIPKGRAYRAPSELNVTPTVGAGQGGPVEGEAPKATAL